MPGPRKKSRNNHVKSGQRRRVGMDNDVKQQPRLRRYQNHQLSEVRQRHGNPNNISSKSSKENSLPEHNRQTQIMKRKGQTSIRSTTSSPHPHHSHGIMDTNTPPSSAEPEREVVPQIDPSVPQPVVQSRRRPFTRAFSWLKAPSSAFTFKTLLRHYAKRASTPRSLNVKLGPRHKSQKGRAGWLA